MNDSLRCAAAVLLAAACCACSSQAERERAREVREMKEAEIAAVLEAGQVMYDGVEVKRCISTTQYSDFRVLDERRILFYGRGQRQWINTLRGQCFDLRHADVLVLRRTLAMSLCELDTFTPTDWFEWPWYRRWPWRWGVPWWGGGTCVLGKFQSVNEAQLRQIEAIIRER